MILDSQQIGNLSNRSLREAPACLNIKTSESRIRALTLKAQAEQERHEHLSEGPHKYLSRLEMRCSLTAKQNSKGKKLWFIGYKARTTVERTNSKLKDGFLPDKIYRRGCYARYDIGLSILLTSLKKIRSVLLAWEALERYALLDTRVARSYPKAILSCLVLAESSCGFHCLIIQQPGLDDIALSCRAGCIFIS